MRGDLPRCGQDVTCIGGAVFTARRAHGNINHVHLAAGFLDLGCETKRMITQTVGDNLFQPRLEDRAYPAPQLFDPVDINIQAFNLVSGLSKTGRRDQTDIATTDD